MEFTKAKLDSQNKTQLVDLVLGLHAQVEAANGKPLTGSTVEKRLLDLGEQANQVKLKAQESAQKHKEKLAEINAAKEKEIKKLELEFASEEGRDGEALLNLYTEIEAKAEKAIADLSYGLKQAEIEAKGKLEAIEAQVAEAQASAEAKISDFETKVSTTKSKTEDEINTIKVNHTREVEQLNYDNKIAIRDSNVKVATKIAESVGQVLVDTNKLKQLESYAKAGDDEVAEAISDAVDAAKADIYSKEGAKYSTLKSSTDNTIALLENDKKHLAGTVASQAARIEDLENRLKDVPSQIAAAVEAARSNVSVTQAAGK